jgi:stage IV sporulation protein FB
LFVYVAAAAESGEVSLREAARRVPVDRAMVRTFESLGTRATVDEAADALIRTTQREFPVVDGGGRLRGFLSRDAMIKALKATGPATPVLDVMTRDVPTVRLGQSLELALRLMQEGAASEIAVVGDDERLVGYVTRENLAEFLMIEDAGAEESSDERRQRASM